MTWIAGPGRFEWFASGAPCGQEQWRVEPGEHGGMRLSGEQVLEAPHPFPSRTRWRASLSPHGRVVGLEIEWRVGARELHAVHAADGERWSVRVTHGGHTREQEGDYPPYCEVVFGSPLLWQALLRRYAWGEGATHEFPALVVGPPWMAVEPGRLRVECSGYEPGDADGGRVRVHLVHDLGGGAAPWRLETDAAEQVVSAYESTDRTELMFRRAAPPPDLLLPGR